MGTTINGQQELPADLVDSLLEARNAIAQQKYADALLILQQGLDRKYDPSTLNGLELIKHFLGLVWILKFNLQQTHGEKWEAKVRKVPEKETQCSFCGRTYAEVASLISGAESNICEGCVGICNEILADVTK